MGLLYGAALFIAALVVGPYLAHRLRRRRADTVRFAPAHLVPPTPPRARRRAKLEDRALFSIRAVSIVGLAVLGAAPFVRCSRLALARSGGASVALAIVVDDSMSMQAGPWEGGAFARAKAGARELVQGAREGDAVAIVLAGAPARVALAPTTDLGSVRASVDGLAPTDRATDLDGAIALARGLLEGMPENDRRIVLLSDLADGRSDAAPLGEGSSVPIWNALPELRASGQDCGVVRADRSGARVLSRVVCTPGSTPSGRRVGLFEGEKKLAEAPAPTVTAGDIVLMLPKEASLEADQPGRFVVKLLGQDAIAEDDAAVVLSESAPGSVAVVVDAPSETAATGGPPVVEQALAALELDVTVRPLPQVPERADELNPFLGLVLDDPPGLTPEERRAVSAFVDRGGVVLLALGPRSGSAPLGASFTPLLAHAVRWSDTKVKGANPETAAGELAASAPSWADLGATHRASLDPEDVSAYAPRLLWQDGAPLVMRRGMGRGEVWVVTLPFALQVSDLPLRPAFLTLLAEWAEAARSRTAPRRTTVGEPWVWNGAHHVTLHGPAGDVAVSLDGGAARALPERLGLYHAEVDGRPETRVLALSEREVDLHPRRLATSAAGHSLGESHAQVDASPYIAGLLLLLFAAELVIRARAWVKPQPGAAS